MYTDEFLQKTKEEWMKKYDIAKANMENLGKAKDIKVLIEVAAQHPLIDGEYPNEEFKKRLDLGIALFNEERAKGRYVEFYVPGSRHVYNGVADKIALSKAGKNYLLSKGIEGKYIRGEDLNDKYKGEDGVYNSADECYVASCYFKDNGFNKLISVLSPVQIMRKSLIYIEFGVIPLCYSAPTENTFHNYISEATFSVPYVLYEDHSWQGKDSVLGNKTRHERDPKYLNKKCK